MIPRTFSTPTAVRTIILVLTAVILLSLLAVGAAKQKPTPQPDVLRNLGCRFVHRVNDQIVTLTPLIDVNLDTVSADPADYTFGTTIKGGRRLAASVRNVKVALPRERYNITITLDGRTHLRVNHMDLDIYIETVIDNTVYVLHCFPDFVVE